MVLIRVERRGDPERFQERLGDDVGGIPGVAQHGVREGVQGAVVAAAQLGESVSVAGSNPHHQIPIRRKPARLRVYSHGRALEDAQAGGGGNATAQPLPHPVAYTLYS